MKSPGQKGYWRSLLSDYGMLGVLLLLAVVLSVATYGPQEPGGDQAARELAPKLRGKKALIVVRDGSDGILFAERMVETFQQEGIAVAQVVKGQPPAARKQIAELARNNVRFDVYVCNRPAAAWTIYQRLAEEFPYLKDVPIYQGTSFHWPSFLRADNLLNIANQIAVIAIMAIGMTMVIIARGIDLSVGSLIALAAVLTTLLIQDYAGGKGASDTAVMMCALAGIAACGLVGLGSGAIVAAFEVPSFVVTLGVMLSASGLAYMISAGESISAVPDSFSWLGTQSTFFLPNAVILMLVLYLLAHVLMSRTVLGRYIYAVGGNPQAARFAGVSVAKVTITVFAINGLLAGLGGVILASQLSSGAPRYGQMYELFVIAAVVLGGTSLSGGQGKILGTLIGAFLIAIIQNGMNLMGLRSYTQRVVLGGVIVGAVLLDRVRRGRG